jgi:O-antigen biosynthesis protein WbqP
VIKCQAGDFERMKRWLDALLSGVFLLFSWPVLLFVALVIRLESPGPAIFTQLRVGRNRRLFTCYKFRTMHWGTADLPTHQIRPSSVTGLGRRLRRLKFDELPQLFNVMVGDMSLVGPRPCLPSQLALIEARQRLGVFAARPGITGLAQVQGVDMSDAERMAEIDARYVRTQSLREDVKLVWATLRGQGVGVDQVKRSS